MRIKILAVKNRRKKALRAGLFLLLAAVIVFFVEQRKDFLVQEAKRSLETVLSHESEFEVRIGRMSGKLGGEVRFEDVAILTREHRTVFSTKEISFHYRFLDFLSKKLDSKISVLVKDPKAVWSPRVRLERRHYFPFMEWMRDWALGQRNNIDISVRNLEISSPLTKTKLQGVNISYKDSRLDVEIPFRHLSAGPMDISTVLKARGQFHLGLFGGEDSIEGEMYTEGSVINWSPLPEESHFNFSFTRSVFQLDSARVLGGIDLEGKINFQKDYEVHWSLKAKNYPLSNLNFIFKSSPANFLPASADVELLFDGSMFAPTVQGRARIYKGYIGKKTYKAMDLNVGGVYPTVKLENSRLLLNDDSVMKFADKTVEFDELFHEKTYQTLVTEAQQDTVVWGDWEFHRPPAGDDQSQILMQRSLGDSAHLNFREYKRDETVQTREANKVEVGLEYNLPGKESLKLELRDDEKFVGVERKVKF